MDKYFLKLHITYTEINIEVNTEDFCLLIGNQK